VKSYLAQLLYTNLYRIMSNYDSFGGTTFNNPSSNFGGGGPGPGNPPGVDPDKYL
jgi:hypothetical protein